VISDISLLPKKPCRRGAFLFSPHALVSRLLADLVVSMGTPPPDKDSPPREVISRLGDNWSPLILKVLETGTYRHATLQRLIGALSNEGKISQRMLTLRLKALTRDGFVLREVDTSVPPRVTYSLTPLGLKMTVELNRLIDWIVEHAPEIEVARQHYND